MATRRRFLRDSTLAVAGAAGLGGGDSTARRRTMSPGLTPPGVDRSLTRTRSGSWSGDSRGIANRASTRR